MSPYDFDKVRRSNNLEAATHEVFDLAYDIWTEAGPKALSVGMLTVYCVETFFGEVCNGGIEQYLENESGQLVEHCAAALRRVELPLYARIMDEALSRCEKLDDEEFADLGDPRGTYIAWTIKEDAGDDSDEGPLEDLNDRFFELYFADKTEFRRKLFQYIVEHESEFVDRNVK